MAAALAKRYILSYILNMFEHIFRTHDDCGRRGERGFARRGEFGGEGRGEFGHGFGRHGRHRGGFGSRERLFDAGDIKLVVLKLLSEQPSYGYQLIKTMEERLAGGYSPSAGVIYPTLTMLEEEGLTTASLENNKKVYSVTPDGVEYLQANGARIEELFARLEEAGKGFERVRSPELMKAFHNLQSAIRARMSRGDVKSEKVGKIADAINAAAKAIDAM